MARLWEMPAKKIKGAHKRNIIRIAIGMEIKKQKPRRTIF